MKKRSEIEEKYKWDLTKFFASDEDFFAHLKKLEKRAEEFKKFDGKLDDDAEFLKYLNFKSKVMQEAGLTSYCYLRQCENIANRQANEMMEKRGIVITKLSLATAPHDAEINKFPMERLQRLHQDSKFKLYWREIEDVIRHKKHALSKKEELLLSSLEEFTGGFEENFDKFSDVGIKPTTILDSKGKKHPFHQSNYTLYAESKDRTLRENAFKEINGKRGEFIDFLANNYINEVKMDCVFAKLRHYKSALAQSIYNEEASEDVYRMLIKKVRENVELQHRFFEIKRKMLKLPKFAIYDTFAPVAKMTDKKFTIEEAIELVKEAVAVLGEDYVSLVQRALDERWIDVFPNENKRGGAFESGTYGVTPVVLLNFEGNLESVFTLAHELGHAMHSYLSDKHQPFQTSAYEIFVAEVASNVNEQLLLTYLLERAESDEEKIYYYDHFLKDMRSSIFRQTMFAEFEEFAHAEYEKEMPLSAELLCDKYEELNNFYHGKKVKQIKEMRYEWARIPHFYDSFYVYKYATGLICAIKIASKLRKDVCFAKKYLTFLSSGGSQDPISLLKIAECDLTKEETFDEAFGTCEKFISLWEKLI